jgi:hypothetical protein
MNAKNTVLIVVVVLVLLAGVVFTWFEFIKPARWGAHAPGLAAEWAGADNGKDPVSGNRAALTDVTLVPGQVGQGYAFNGESSAIRIPASKSLDMSAGGGFTMEAWINCSDVTKLNPIFEWNRGNGVTWEGPHFYVWKDGALLANIVATDGNVFTHSFFSKPGVINSNEFYYVALTYDNKSGAAVIYLNGMEAGRRKVGPLKLATKYDLYVGYRPPTQGETYHFSGIIDQPAVHDRALTHEEIMAMYQADLKKAASKPQ